MINQSVQGRIRQRGERIYLFPFFLFFQGQSLFYLWLFPSSPHYMTFQQVGFDVYSSVHVFKLRTCKYICIYLQCWLSGWKAPAPCGHRQSEFRELALTGRYCRVHLASVQFGRGYEPIDSPYSTQYGPWRERSLLESGQLLLYVMDRVESSTLADMEQL